jgi:hypothetical protein
MSNIPGSANYIQIEAIQTRNPDSSQLANDMGASINYLLGQSNSIQMLEFYSSTVFTLPAGVKYALVLGCGGGGGGSSAPTAGGTPGGVGGGGAPLGIHFIDLSTLGPTVNITIGAGGAAIGGGGGYFKGNDGGASSFGPLTFFGGKGGDRNYAWSGGTSGTGIQSITYWNGCMSGIVGTGYYPDLIGQSNGRYAGGGFGGGMTAVRTGSGGGAGPFGDGGRSGDLSLGQPGANAAANSGAGGGGGSSAVTPVPEGGGAGGSGRIQLYYVTKV